MPIKNHPDPIKNHIKTSVLSCLLMNAIHWMVKCEQRWNDTTTLSSWSTTYLPNTYRWSSSQSRGSPVYCGVIVLCWRFCLIMSAAGDDGCFSPHLLINQHQFLPTHLKKLNIMMASSISRWLLNTVLTKIIRSWMKKWSPTPLSIISSQLPSTLPPCTTPPSCNTSTTSIK